MAASMEEILAAARQEFSATGSVNVEELARAYPEQAGDVRLLVPALVALWDEARTEQAVRASTRFAVDLLRRGMAARQAGAPAPAPVGQAGAPAAAGQAAAPAREARLADVMARLERELGPSTVAELEQAGLTAEAVDALRREATSVADLGDPAAVKALAERIGASFRSMRLALSRLLSLDRFLQSGGPALAYTRGEQTSADEAEELLRKVREGVKQDGQGTEGSKDPA